MRVAPFLPIGIVLCLAGPALAGPNAFGTIFAHDANLVYTVDTASYCGLGSPPASCETADTEINGATDATPMVFKVYAAFCPNCSVRLKAMTFGIYFDDPVRISAFGPCIGDVNNGAIEIQGPGWPGNNTGTAIVFQNTLTAPMDEVYWFAGYNYYGSPATFRLGPHPDPVLGGKFADDSIPALQDDIVGYGSIGFDMPGATACPPPPPPPPYGACCTDPDGDGYPNVCNITTEADCTGEWLGYPTCDPNPCPCCAPTGACCTDPDGDGCADACNITTEADCTGFWQGQDTVCDPNPCDCPPVPVREGTWGQIKANYR
jgi:hypothetical protein